ncbi:short-chain dehydrogenase/reductase [Thelonectria olida]|uniref:Short-chain dehydrogenase/reductase n=1 Tax=Thelonectria olida TaxID=1576542 RepID=A0A9P8W0C9_9HYPO|nr:short-chain dehydrogenase/reductase [Thelonectria olida]
MSQIFPKGGVAVITGGASGIGLSLAKKCHRNEMRVIIADRDEEALDAAIKGLGAAVTTHKMDVGHREDWEVLTQMLHKDFGGKVDFLALNAGMVAQSSWTDASIFEHIYRTNILGVVNGIAALLPLVETTASAGTRPSIIITGSKQGITNPPGNPAYNSSKAAVKSLAEHLSWDLRDKNISVHLLIPGWTYTGMSGNRFNAGTTKPDGAWWPDQVVDYLEKKIQEGQFWVVCPDNDVSEDLDKKRVKWAVGDLVEGRPPLSRWREDWKEQAQKSIDGMDS